MITLKELWGKRTEHPSGSNDDTAKKRKLETRHIGGESPKTLFTWNVNGLTQRIRLSHQWKEFSSYIEHLQPDVICLQEVKLAAESPRGAKQSDGQPRQRDTLKRSEESHAKEAMEVESAWRGLPFSNYHIWWSLADWRYAGQLVAVRKSCTVENVSFNFVGEEGHNKDGRIIQMSFEHFNLLSLYSPMNGTKMDKFDRRREFDSSLCTLVRQLSTDTKPLVVMGDLNCAFEDCDLSHPAWFRRQVLGDRVPSDYIGQPGCTPAERRQFREIIESGNLVDIHRRLNPAAAINPDIEGNLFSWRGHAGRDTNESGKYYGKGMRVDHALVTAGLVPVIKSCYILGKRRDKTQFFGSDHTPLVLTIDKSFPDKKEYSAAVTGSNGAASSSTGAASSSTGAACSSTSAASSSTSAPSSSTSAACSSTSAACSSTSAACSSTSAACSSTSAACSSTSVFQKP